MKPEFIRAFAVAALAVLLSGCASVSVDSQQEIGLPAYPPTSPESVQILRQPPAKPYQKIGALVARPSNEPSVQVIELKIREAAAKIGADAVIIVSDRTVRTGVMVPGRGRMGGQITPTMERIIAGDAIKYTQQ